MKKKKEASYNVNVSGLPRMVVDYIDSKRANTGMTRPGYIRSVLINAITKDGYDMKWGGRN